MNKLLVLILLCFCSLTGSAQIGDSLSAPALILRTEAIRRLPSDISKAQRALTLSKSVVSPSEEYSSLLDESIQIAAQQDRVNVLAFLYLAKGRMEGLANKPDRLIHYVSLADRLEPMLSRDSALALKKEMSALLQTQQLIIKKTHRNSQASEYHQNARIGENGIAASRLLPEKLFLNNREELRSAYQEAVWAATENNDRELLQSTQIVYANNLSVYGNRNESVSIYKALASDNSLSEKDWVYILCQLVINLYKLENITEAKSYYRQLQEFVKVRERTPVEEEYLMATAMHYEYSNQMLQAKLAYLGLIQKAGASSLLSVDGMIRLATLYSQAYQRDSAEIYYARARKQLREPVTSTALLHEYRLAYQSHLSRYQNLGELTDSLQKALQVQDSQYRQELIAVTKELNLKNQVLENRQRAWQAEQKQQLDALDHARMKKQLLLVILILGLAALSAVLISYVVFYRRRQAAVLHRKELEVLQQKHRSEVLQTLSKAQELERSRIAGQLHDEIGSMLSVARLNLASLKIARGRAVDVAEVKLNTADKLLSDISITIREMSHQLMPIALTKYGLKKAIHQLVADINRAGSLIVEEVMIGLDHADEYSEEFQIAIYRIIQEIMQNLVKHSEADNAIVQIVEHEDLISIVVEDNGKGIQPDEASNGMGLQLLHTRIAYLDGEIVIENGPGGGTLVSVELPLKNKIF